MKGHVDRIIADGVISEDSRGEKIVY